MTPGGLAAAGGMVYIADQTNGTIWKWMFDDDEASHSARVLDSSGVGALAFYDNKIPTGAS